VDRASGEFNHPRPRRPLLELQEPDLGEAHTAAITQQKANRLLISPVPA
jgi:hypothetical protein